MSNMNSTQRKYWYPKIVIKQGGEYCFGCGIDIEKMDEKLLMIDHIDNNNKNNIIENLQLLCRACNRIKNPHRSQTFERAMTPEMLVNRKGEPRFRKWLFDFVLREHFIKWDEAINSGAEICQMSREAIKSYLFKCTSNAGIYDKVLEDEEGDKLVYFKGEDAIVLEAITKLQGLRLEQ